MLESPPDKPVRAFSWPRLCAGLLLGAVALWLVSRQIEWPILVQAASGITIGWLLLAGAIDLTAFGLRALKWRTLLGGSAHVRYPTVFRATVIGALATDILPFRLDELVRAHLLGHHAGLPRARVLGSIAVERALDVTALLVLLGLLAFNLALPRQLHTAGVVLVIALPAAFGLYLALRGRDWNTSVAGRLIEDLLAGVYATRGRILPAAGVCLLEWCALFGMFCAILCAFGLVGIPGHALVLLVTSFLIFAFPISPGAVGVYEVAITSVLAARGVPAEQALAIALAAHAVLLAPTTLLGIVFLALEDLGLPGLLRNTAAPSPRQEAV